MKYSIMADCVGVQLLHDIPVFPLARHDAASAAVVSQLQAEQPLVVCKSSLVVSFHRLVLLS